MQFLFLINKYIKAVSFKYYLILSLLKNFFLGTIHLKNIKFYAYHGCLGEEKKIGADYLVKLKVSANLDKASKSDNLVDAVDYVLLNEIVSSEMKKIRYLSNPIFPFALKITTSNPIRTQKKS